MSEMDAVIAEERENRLKALKLELKKANREVKRLQRENNILSVMNEQAIKFREFSEKTRGQQVFYNAMLLQNSPNISIMLDTELNTVMATAPYYQRSTLTPEQVNQGVPVIEVFDGLIDRIGRRHLEAMCVEARDEGKNIQYMDKMVVHGTE